MIPNGNFPRAMMIYYKNKFKTKEGLFDFFVKSFLFGFFVIEFNQGVFAFLMDFWSFFSFPILQKFFAYTSFGLVAAGLAIVLTFVINKVYEILRIWLR